MHMLMCNSPPTYMMLFFHQKHASHRYDWKSSLVWPFRSSESCELIIHRLKYCAADGARWPEMCCKYTTSDASLHLPWGNVKCDDGQMEANKEKKKHSRAERITVGITLLFWSQASGGRLLAALVSPRLMLGEKVLAYSWWSGLGNSNCVSPSQRCRMGLSFGLCRSFLRCHS